MAQCNPLACFSIFLIIIGGSTSLCAAGYWNLDKKIDSIQQSIMMIHSEQQRTARNG